MYFPLLLYFLEIFYVVIFKALAVNARDKTSFIWPLQVTTYHNLFIVSYIFFICLFYTNKEFLDVSKTFPFYSWRQNDVCCAAQEFWNIFGTSVDISKTQVTINVMRTHGNLFLLPTWGGWWMEHLAVKRTLNWNLIFVFPQWKILRSPYTLKPLWPTWDQIKLDEMSWSHLASHQEIVIFTKVM